MKYLRLVTSKHPFDIIFDLSFLTIVVKRQFFIIVHRLFILKPEFINLDFFYFFDILKLAFTFINISYHHQF
jgi:hypothetical protein